MTEPTAIVLTVETGPCRGASAVIRTAQAVLGRDAGGALRLEDDATVSRRHASLCWESDRWVLRDLASRNGTFYMANAALEALSGPRKVSAGDKIVLGSAVVAISAVRAPVREAAQLRIGLAGNDLTLQLETGAAISVGAARNYPAGQIDAIQRDIQALLATAEASGASVDREFSALGGQLADALLPLEFREHLQALGEQPLCLVLDPGLIGVAWEALCLNGKPLCLERAMSRRILLENAVVRPQVRGNRFLVVANPTGDLPEAQAHGEGLLDLLTWDHALPQVSFLAGRRATIRNVAAGLAGCDVAVYLGHAERMAGNLGGWRLADGLLDAAQIASLPDAPALVVAAACESARESPQPGDSRLLPGGTGIASTFLLAGTQQYVGALWRVPVVSGTAFASVLLTGVLGGMPLGDAVLRARRHLRDVLGAPAHVCAGFVHYGAPGWTALG